MGQKKYRTSKKIEPTHDWIDAVAAFEDDLYRRKRANNTVSSYRSCLNAFVSFYCNDLQKPGPYIMRLQDTDFKAFIDYLRYDRRLSPATVNRHVAALRSFAVFLLANGRHRQLIAQNLITYRVKPPEKSALDRKDVTQLLKSVNLNRRNSLRDFAILQLFLQCGLRVSEITRLLRDDIIINKTSGKIEVRNEKGQQDRTIPLNNTARLALRKYLDSRGPGSGIEPVFISEQRQKLSVASVQYLMKKYLCTAGREDLSAQDLRRHFAQVFYKRSKNLIATQQVLGHRDVNTTTRYRGLKSNGTVLYAKP